MYGSGAVEVPITQSGHRPDMYSYYWAKGMVFIVVNVSQCETTPHAVFIEDKLHLFLLERNILWMKLIYKTRTEAGAGAKCRQMKRKINTRWRGDALRIFPDQRGQPARATAMLEPLLL